MTNCFRPLCESGKEFGEQLPKLEGFSLTGQVKSCKQDRAGEPGSRKAVPCRGLAPEQAMERVEQRYKFVHQEPWSQEGKPLFCSVSLKHFAGVAEHCISWCRTNPYEFLL